MGSFLTFATLFLVFILVLIKLIPEEIEEKYENPITHSQSIDDSQYSYLELLSNRRILFANLSVIVNILQYTFIDPIFTGRMLRDYGYDAKYSALMFFFIALGYSVACQFVYKTLQFVSFRR